MTRTGGKPEFSSMSEAECGRFLARHHVGRLAFVVTGRVDIQPVNYAFHDGWIYGRTQIGSKLAALAYSPQCAFEVDDVRGTYDWDSVVVHGSFEMLDPQTGSVDRYEEALVKVRAHAPEALTAADPVPARLVLFAISASELTGRSARTKDS